MKKGKRLAVFAVLRSEYSLACGEVGKPIDGSEKEIAFDDPADALRELDRQIDHESAKGLVGSRHFVRMPDGRELPLDSAYTEIFGVPPVRGDNKPNKYPLLRKR